LIKQLMFRHSVKMRFGSLFVLVFLCLNASGAACLAYCEEFEIFPDSDSCPLAKLSDDCAKHHAAGSRRNNESVSLPSTEIDCCALAINFVSAPIEGNKTTQQPPAILPSLFGVEQAIVGYASKWNLDSVKYRTPLYHRPPIRLRHCVLRI
jgi:hypothetical protein